MRALAIPSRSPDWGGAATFRMPSGGTQTAECCIFGPRSETDQILMVIRVGEGAIRNSLGLVWKFAFDLSLSDERISANEVFPSGWTMWKWDSKEENSLVAEAIDLSISKGSASDSPRVGVSFAITESALLNPGVIVRRDIAGRASVEVIREGPMCSMEGGMVLQFRSAFSDPDDTSRLTLMAGLTDPRTPHEIDSVANAVEDILIVASLAERHRLHWTSWTVSHANGAFRKHHRRNIAIDAHHLDLNRTLIGPENAEKFLKTVVPIFRNHGYKLALERAIYMALWGENRGIGDSYVMMFSGIETLLSTFIKSNNLRIIVRNRKSWKSVRDVVHDALRQREEVRNLDKDRQSFLYNKIDELNHIGFADAFTASCKSGPDLSDLWPMVTRNEEASLYKVRNRIVHGSTFTIQQECAIVSAKQHLQWTLERLILHGLQWPIEDSRVSRTSLMGLAAYSGWCEDQQTLG